MKLTAAACQSADRVGRTNVHGPHRIDWCGEASISRGVNDDLNLSLDAADLLVAEREWTAREVHRDRKHTTIP